MSPRLLLRKLGVRLSLSLLGLLAAGPVVAAPTRTVTIDDADHDGRYTGADITAAIARCTPGCILQALPQTYADVEVTLGPGMTEGLILQGAGIGRTTFNARVPQVGPVIRVAGAVAAVIIRDLTVDGRKSEQTSAALDGEGSGIAIATPWVVPSPAGIVERIEASNFIMKGVMVRDGAGWEVRDSLIHDIGCNLDFPCPKLVPRTADPIVQGRKTTGFGISVIDANASGTIVHHNNIWNISKIGIEAFRWNASRPPTDFWFHDNQITTAADSGITSNQGMNGRIENNTVQACGGTNIIGNLGAGITCEGATANLVVRGNTVRSNQGAGLRLGCKGPLTVEANVVQGNCTKQIGNAGEINAGNPSHDGAGLVLRDNVVSPDANGAVCNMGLLIEGYTGVTVDGGSYRGGPNSIAGVYITHSNQLVFRNTSIDGGGSGFYINPDVDGVSIEGSVQITHAHGLAVNNTGAKNVTVAVSSPSPAPPAQPAPLGAPGRPSAEVP